MNKEDLKQIRNKLIQDMWSKRKAELSMEEIAYIFSVSLAQTYLIIKKENQKVV